MGQRTVNRVPLDFDHPLKEVWPGYLSPPARPCPAGPDCVNGYTRDRAWLEAWVHVLMVPANSPEHPWVRAVPTISATPTAAFGELTKGLAGRIDPIMGHDAIDRWKATKAVVAAAGLDPETWGICPECHGRAYHPGDVAEQEAWEPTEPPEGEGWQLWETTSEGSPVSPVFATPEDLASWCAENATLFGDFGATRSEWLSMIRDETVDVGSTMTVRSA